MRSVAEKIDHIKVTNSFLNIHPHVTIGSASAFPRQDGWGVGWTCSRVLATTIQWYLTVGQFWVRYAIQSPIILAVFASPIKHHLLKML